MTMKHFSALGTPFICSLVVMTAGIPTMSVQTEKLHELCVETACRYKIFTVILTAYVFGRKMRHLL